MAKDVYMPMLGMNQETGTLLRWLKREGEAVTQGEPLMEVATDKTDMEIDAPASGILRNVTAQEGDEVPVGQVIGQIAAADEVIAAPPAAAPEPSPVPAPTPDTAPPAISPVAARMVADHGLDATQIKRSGNRIQKEDVLAYLASQPVIGGKVLASPKARRLAEEQGLDLAAIAGSGPQGAVLAEDVLAVQAAQSSAPAAAALHSPTALVREAAGQTDKPAGGQTSGQADGQTVVPMSRMWKVMAERLAQSWTTVPHFFLAREVDASAFKAWHLAAQARSQSKLTYSDLLVKLVALTLRAHPRVNAAWVDGQIVANDAVHVGLAVAVEEGLLVPVIRHADQLGLGALASARADLVARAQAGKLAVSELQGGTFTISNLGMFGIDQFSAIVNPPQAAILAVGQIADRVVARDGQPAVRPMMTLNLSADHRVVDGARAARFLADLGGLIEDPLRALE
jgi:pyruvate dehydrogenase E2 component (dihydrolipoamide acetyltransferase)